jgi:hypothetical protein
MNLIVEILEWLVAGLLGTLVGIAELISRYKDEPGHALGTLPAGLYLVINALASVAALLFVRVFGWTFGVTDTNLAGWVQAMVAGFGAMAILRASLFTVKSGDETISIGPNRFLEAMLTAVDRGVDRKRGEVRAKMVSKIMKEISFEKAFAALPVYCFTLMQNLSPEDQKTFGEQIKLFSAYPTSPRVKSMVLGLLLMNMVGEDVLNAAIQSIGDDLKPDAQPVQPAPAP